MIELSSCNISRYESEYNHKHWNVISTIIDVRHIPDRVRQFAVKKYTLILIAPPMASFVAIVTLQP